jgi:hypothetical protein
LRFGFRSILPEALVSSVILFLCFVFVSKSKESNSIELDCEPPWPL